VVVLVHEVDQNAALHPLDEIVSVSIGALVRGQSVEVLLQDKLDGVSLAV
jgi:hypothetical protein